jgi:replicative superfamily II helicase
VPQDSIYVSNSEYLQNGGPNGLTSSVDEIVQSAKQFVWIAVPWFYTSARTPWIISLVERLSARKKEGLDVRIFVRPDVSNHETINTLNLVNAKVFSKKQIIRHIHTKMVLNESKLLAMTANLTDFDLFRNLNTGILTGLSKEVAKAKVDFERLVEEDVIKQADFKDANIQTVLPRHIADFFGEQYPRLNPVQTAVAPYLLRRSENLLIGTETGTGKTLMAEIAIWDHLSRGSKSKALYIAPLRAITAEKEQTWQKFAAVGVSVYKITGDEETVDEEKARKARLLLTTGEKWDSLTRKPRRFPFIRDIDLVILDEIHIVDDENRGPTTEVLLARLRRTLPKARIIGLSATMKNIEQLAKWLNADKYHNTAYRPVPLTLAFHDLPDTRYYNISEQTKDKVIHDAVEMLLTEKTGTGKRGKILIFTGSRKKAEEAAFKIANSIKLLETPYSTNVRNPRLQTVMEKGAAFVHAGLAAVDRKTAINAFDEGPIDVLAATTSLAWGVNVAARTVIIRDIRVAMQKDIDFLDLKQMIGRAGRVGKENAAYAIILVPFKERGIVESALIEGKDIESKLEKYILDHINAEINLGIINNEHSLREWFTTTFWYYQNHEKGLGWQAFLKDQISLLTQNGFVEQATNSLMSTRLGKLTSDWYIHVKTAIALLEGLKTFDYHACGDCERAELTLLRLLATSEEDFSVVLRSLEEREEIQAFIEANPMFAKLELETAKVAMVLANALKGAQLPEEENQTIRLAVGHLGYISELGVLKENYSAYVIARDMARRLQYHGPRGSGELLNLIWFSTPNNDEKERTVRNTYRLLERDGINNPIQLRDWLDQSKTSTDIPHELAVNTRSRFPFVELPKIDGKHMGEEIMLLLPHLPEEYTLVTTQTGLASNLTITQHNEASLNLTKIFPNISEKIGIKSFWIEFIAFNKLGWSYAKSLCELLILPNSWNPSILQQLESLLSSSLPQVRSTSTTRRLLRSIKKIFSYTAYAKDLIETTDFTDRVAQILTQNARSTIAKILEIGFFVRKNISIEDSDGEPQPLVNILRQKRSNVFGLSILICSLLRSAGVSCDLAEVRGKTRHVLPVCADGSRRYLLDVSDETQTGIDVRSSAAKQFEVLHLNIPYGGSLEESQKYEWVENYSDDQSPARYNIRNFTQEEYSTLGSKFQFVEASVMKVQETSKKSKPTSEKPKLRKNAQKEQNGTPTISLPCPQCGAELKVITSKQSGKRYISCSQRLSSGCKFSLSLPPVGKLNFLGKHCHACGFQIMRIQSPDHRSFESCPNCYTLNKKRRN